MDTANPSVTVNVFGGPDVTIRFADGRKLDMTRDEARDLFRQLRLFVSIRDEDENALIESATKTALDRIDASLAGLRLAR